MDRMKQIEDAIKAENDKFFYAATRPKSALEMQMIITRVNALLRLKYELICKGIRHE